MFVTQVRPGLELRLLEDRHAEQVFTLVDQNRGRLREWLPWVDQASAPEDTRKFIRRSLDQFAANLGFAAGVWWEGHIAGVVGTLNIDWLNRKVEIGYWLGEAFERRGLITDSVRALVTHAFAEWKLNRVQIQCAVRNTRSAAIPRRLGFTLEGSIRQGQYLNGRYDDLLMFGMLASEWQLT